MPPPPSPRAAIPDRAMMARGPAKCNAGGYPRWVADPRVAGPSATSQRTRKGCERTRFEPVDRRGDRLRDQQALAGADPRLAGRDPVDPGGRRASLAVTERGWDPRLDRRAVRSREHRPVARRARLDPLQHRGVPVRPLRRHEHARAPIRGDHPAPLVRDPALHADRRAAYRAGAGPDARVRRSAGSSRRRARPVPTISTRSRKHPVYGPPSRSRSLSPSAWGRMRRHQQRQWWRRPPCPCQPSPPPRCRPRPLQPRPGRPPTMWPKPSRHLPTCTRRASSPTPNTRQSERRSWPGSESGPGSPTRRPAGSVSRAVSPRATPRISRPTR